MSRRKKFDTDTWLTPKSQLELVRKLWKTIALDPFHNPKSYVKAKRRYDLTKGQDAYELPWFDKSFANGPYSSRFPQRTAAKCAEEARLKHRVLNLAPAAPGSKYWKEHVWNDASGIAWLGRLAFVAPQDVYDAEGTLVAKRGKEIKGNRTEIAMVSYGPPREGKRFKKLYEAAGYPVSLVDEPTWGKSRVRVNNPVIVLPELYVEDGEPVMRLKARLLR
jgi:hypothetical protein